MHLKFLSGFVIWLAACAPTACAAEGAFFELDGFNGFWASPGVPDAALNRLKEVQSKGKEELKCIAFTPQGDWVFLFGSNGFWTSNGDLPACKKLKEMQQQGRNLKSVAFSPAGGWTVLWDQTGNWTEGSIPDGAFKKMQEIAQRGGTLRSVAFGRDGAWVVLTDKTGVWFGDVPPNLAKILNTAIKNQNPVQCVAFTSSDWTCLAQRGWWTSNADLSTSKFIRDYIKKGHSPKWVAVVPTLGKHDFAKWSQMIHGALDGKLAGGFAFEVLEEGKVVASGAAGWARAPWEKEHPSLPWTLDKPMGVASVSKTITAVALLKLWEEHQKTNRKFSLDEPFWPRIKAVCPNAHADVKRVTIRQLLMHRSGFQKTDDYITPRDVEKLLQAPPAHKPGDFYEYQNNNFYLLHIVLEQIGEVQYTPYVKEHVLKPMGIEHMETHAEAQQPMCCYAKLGSNEPGDPIQQDCAAWAGAAGWYASASDLGRFLAGIRDHRVLAPATTAMMLKDNMGWDGSEPGWSKGGLWPSGERQFGSVIAHFPDGVDAILLVNAQSPAGIQELLAQAWRECRD